MKTYESILGFTKTILIVSALSASPFVPVCAQQLYEGTGVVSAAKCQGASIFRDQSGQSFEIDNSRTSPAKNVPLTIRGKVYPRISVCKVYPWLDVSDISSANFARREATSSSVPLDDGVIELTLERGDFAGAAIWLAKLAARADVTKVRIRIPENAAERLPSLVLALGPSAPATIAKTEISTTSSKRPVFSWSNDGQKKAFTSLSELKNALLI